MPRPVWLLVAAFSSVALVVIAAGPAAAQYMFLDTNGDGQNIQYQEWSSGDTVQADLYIVTDKNRDGSNAACESDGTPIELHGFSAIFESFFYPVEVVAVEPQIAGMVQTFAPVATPYGLTVGYSTPPLPPGKYLALRIKVRSQSLEIVPSSCIAPTGVTTSVVTNCAGFDDDYTALVDGVGYGYFTDPPNRRSITTAPPTISAVEEVPTSFNVNVFDPECGYNFSLWETGMPSGASFSGLGSFGYQGASGTFSWTPSIGQAGEYDVVFETHDDDPFNMTNNPQSHTTHITVAPSVPLSANQLPVARSGGPYSAVTGLPVRFHAGASSDPEGEPLHFAWNFGDGQLGAGLDVAHAYANAGEYTVVLTATNASGAAGQDPTTVTVVSGGLSLIRSIAPNPARTAPILEIVTTRTGAVTVRVFDVHGRLVTQTDESMEAGLHQVSIPRDAAGAQGSGIYFVQVNTEYDGTATRRVVLLR